MKGRNLDGIRQQDSMRSLMEEFMDPSQRVANQEGYQLDTKEGLDIISPDDFYQHRYNMLRKNTKKLINNIDDEIAQNQIHNSKKIVVRSDTFSPTSNMTNQAHMNQQRLTKSTKLKELNKLD